MDQQGGGAAVAYWNALKARLPLWRASAESRQMWQQALRGRTPPPIIDADLIGPGDLKNPVPGDAAYDIWALRNHLMQLTPAPMNLAEMDAMMSDALGTTVADLESLEVAEQQGTAVDGRLEQLNVSREALIQLLRVRALLNDQAPVMDSEWSDVYSILAQVVKMRQNAGWRHAEAAAHITLSQDFFQIPELSDHSAAADGCPPPDVAPLPAWRATWSARRDWQDSLQSRLDQQNAVVLELSQASDAVEEATMTTLRDALIMANPVDGDCPDTKAQGLTSRFLLEMRESSCEKTTRIAQSLETIQTLLWGTRTGEIELPGNLAAISPDLGLNFDAEWIWMGSYASWRSAMLICNARRLSLGPSVKLLRRAVAPSTRRIGCGSQGLWTYSS
jgi:hypothetical protein